MIRGAGAKKLSSAFLLLVGLGVWFALSARTAVNEMTVARDSLVAARVPDNSIPKVFDQLSLGPLEVLSALGSATSGPGDWGFVVEAR